MGWFGGARPHSSMGGHPLWFGTQFAQSSPFAPSWSPARSPSIPSGPIFVPGSPFGTQMGRKGSPARPPEPPWTLRISGFTQENMGLPQLTISRSEAVAPLKINLPSVLGRAGCATPLPHGGPGPFGALGPSQWDLWHPSVPGFVAQSRCRLRACHFPFPIQTCILRPVSRPSHFLSNPAFSVPHTRRQPSSPGVRMSRKLRARERARGVSQK